MRTLLQLLVLALPTLTLTQDPPTGTPFRFVNANTPRLRFPASNTASTCPRAPSRNLFARNPFHAYDDRLRRPGLDPAVVNANDRSRPETVRRDGLSDICQQVGGFAFGPLADHVVATHDLLLQPGKQHVFSIAANVVVRRLSAIAYQPGRSGPGAPSIMVANEQPYRQTGTLVLAPTKIATEMFFVVTFADGPARGEVGLFAIGGG